MTWLLLASLPVSFCAGWAAALHTITKRQAQAEYRYLISSVVQHSVEDAARKVGC